MLNYAGKAQQVHNINITGRSTSLSMKVNAWRLVQGLATGTWTCDGHGMHVDYTIILHHWTTTSNL